MPNIVYVLTNPAMPGIVKIGMTDEPDVLLRMKGLYTTSVPLPFECIIAREIEGRDAGEIESALHTAFEPNRINPSREFFKLDPEQVEVLLRVMPGKDVTPPDADQLAELPPDDREASSEFKERQSRTNEPGIPRVPHRERENRLRKSAGAWKAARNENQLGP